MMNRGDPFAHLYPNLVRLDEAEGHRLPRKILPWNLESAPVPPALRVGQLTTLHCEEHARLFHPLQVSSEGDSSLRRDTWSRYLRADSAPHATLTLDDVFEQAHDMIVAERLDVVAWVGHLDRETCVSLASEIGSWLGDPAADALFYWWPGDFPAKGSNVYQGPLTVVKDFIPYGDSSFESPNLWWGTDEDWYVATYVDFTSTYVGGARSLIDRLVAAPHLEAVRVNEETEIVGATAYDVSYRGL